MTIYTTVRTERLTWVHIPAIPGATGDTWVAKTTRARLSVEQMADHVGVHIQLCGLTVFYAKAPTPDEGRDRAELKYREIQIGRAHV